MIIKYNHHDREVYVEDSLQGKHRNHCLCFKCGRFNPGMPETNCPTANLLYAVCIKCGITTPVYECPDFFPDVNQYDHSFCNCIGTAFTTGGICLSCGRLIK